MRSHSPIRKPPRTADVEDDGQVYTSNEVARLARVTARQLQWWDERGLVSPHQEGHKRFYKPAEVVEIMVMSELRRKRLSLKKIRRVLPAIKREMDRYRRSNAGMEAELYLITDMKTVHLEHRAEAVVELYKKSRLPMFLVCVSDQRKLLVSEKASRHPERQLELFP